MKLNVFPAFKCLCHCSRRGDTITIFIGVKQFKCCPPGIFMIKLNNVFQTRLTCFANSSNSRIIGLTLTGGISVRRRSFAFSIWVAASNSRDTGWIQICQAKVLNINCSYDMNESSKASWFLASSKCIICHV